MHKGGSLNALWKEAQAREERALGLPLGDPVTIGDGPVKLQRFTNGWILENPGDESVTLVWEGRDIYLPAHKRLPVQMRVP